MSSAAADASARARRRKPVRAAALDRDGDNKRSLYHCNYCQRDISNTPRIRCAVCADFDLCIECFSVGAEITPHSNTHDYRVIDNLSFPLFHPEWGVDEELLLIEALDIYGLGSWAAVADHIGSGKTPTQCKAHFFQVYIDPSSYPLPTPLPEMIQFQSQQPQAASFLSNMHPTPSTLTSSVVATRSKRRGGVISQQQPQSLPLLQSQQQQQQQLPEQQQEDSVVKEAQAAVQTQSAETQPDTQQGQTANEQQPIQQDAAGAERPETAANPKEELVKQEARDGVDGNPIPVDGGTLYPPAEKENMTPDGAVVAGSGVSATEQQQTTSMQGAAEATKTEPEQQQQGMDPASQTQQQQLHQSQQMEQQQQEVAQQQEQQLTTQQQQQRQQQQQQPADAADAAPVSTGQEADELTSEMQGTPVVTAQTTPEGVAHLTTEQQAAVQAQKRLHRNPHAEEEASSPVGSPKAGTASKKAAAKHVVSGGISLHLTTADDKDAAVAASSRAAPSAGSRTAAATATPASMAAPQPKQSGKEPKPTPVHGDYAMGYHVKRNEFDPEYDNDAECIIADMEFNENDSEEDRALKLRMLEIYNMRLDMRESRHAFLKEYGLLSMRKVQALDRKRSLAERDTHARLRVFARYSAPAAHDDLVEGLLTEQRLRARIQELKTYRRLGLRTVEEAEIYDSETRKAKRQQGEGSSPYTLAGGGWDGTPLMSGGGAATPGGGAAGLGAASAAAMAAAAKDTGAASSATAPPLGGNKNAAHSLQLWRTHRGVQLDVTCLPGVELLSAREREACASLRLLPLHYLALKDMMLRDSAKHGAIARHEARNFFRLDSYRSFRLYDLWVSCGWITPEEPKKKGGAGATQAAQNGPTGEGTKQVKQAAQANETEMI